MIIEGTGRDESSEGCHRHHHANVLGLEGAEDAAFWGQFTSSYPGQVPGAGPLVSVQIVPSCLVSGYKILGLDEIIASYNGLVLFCFLKFLKSIALNKLTFAFAFALFFS